MASLGGTEGATYAFWSTDSRFIAFLAQNKLKKIGVAGGEVVTLCDASFGSSGARNSRRRASMSAPPGRYSRSIHVRHASTPIGTT